MKKFLLFTLACFAMISAKAWTVYYTNPEGWETVYAYAFDGAGGQELGNWPGTEMTQDGDLWVIEGEGTPDNIIFDNGEGGDGNQTEDLVFEDGKTYNDPAKGSTNVGGGESWTVYYTNPEGWEAVYAYTYGGDGEVLGSWPGKAMTLNDGVWSVAGTGVPTNIIFDNGEGGEGNQTEDLVFEAGKTYNDPAKGNAGNEGPGPETSVDAPEQLYFIGGPAGWTEDYGWEMAVAEEGVFYIEDVEFPETGYFAFTAKLGSWKDINDNRVAPATKDAAFVVSETDGNPFVWGVDASWEIPAGTYDFYVNFKSMKVGNTLQAAPVKSLNAENGEEVIYNLQGVKVNKNNMTPGIYVVNGKKVVVK